MTKPWLRPSYHDCIADEDTFLSAPGVWNHPGHKWTYQHSSKETGLYRCTQERAITNQVPLRHKWKDRKWLFNWNNPRSTFCLSAFMLVLRLPLCPSVYQIICLFVSRVYARLTYLLVCLSVCWPACAHGHTYMFGLAKPLFTPLPPPPPLIPRKKFYLRHGALKRSHKFISVTSVTTFPCLARDIWCDTLKLRSTKTKH